MALLPGQQYVQNAAGAWVPVGYAATALPAPAALRDPNTGRSSLVGTFAPLNVADLIGLVNTTFYSTTSITDNYTTANTGSATSTVTLNDGFALLATGTTNPSTAQITSRDFATYNGIGELMFLNGLRAPQAGVAGVVKRWGAYDGTNGYFFEDNAGVFTVVGIKNGVRTAVASGSFNGLLGATYTLDQNSHFFQILMTGGRAVFMVDQITLHTLATPAGVTTTSGSLNLPIRVEIVSTQTVNQTLEIRGQNIGRLGPVDSKRLNEALLDGQDAGLVRAVLSATTGVANSYVNSTATVVGTKNTLDINLAGSQGGAATSSGAVSAAAVSTVTGTVNTTSVIVANVGQSGNATVVLYGGTYTALQLFFEASIDGTNWATVDGTRGDGTGVDGPDGTTTFAAAAARMWNVACPGFTYLRARVGTITATVNPTIAINQGPFLWDPSPITRDFLAGSGKRTIYTAFVSVAPSVTDTLVTLTPYRAGVAGTAATSLGVTAGRTLRIQSIALNMRSTTAAIASGSIFLRYNPTGTTVIGSPIAEALGAATAAAVIGQGAGVNLSLADGMELSGAGTFGISLYGIAAGTANIVIKGYEFA